MTDLPYKWRPGNDSVLVSGEISLPQFKILGHRKKLIERSVLTGNYSRLHVEIVFNRSMGYYMIQVSVN